MSKSPIDLKEIQAAQKRISPYIRNTPLIRFDYLSRLLNKNILLKCESLQATGSFKIRGATNCILENLAQSKKSGVVAASAGNHAQGVAAICHQLGIQATIVMPEFTPAIKVQNTLNWGAKVELVGKVYDDSYEHAMKLSEKLGLLFVHPFKDTKVMAGQGTIGLELAESTLFDGTEAVLVCVGGGGIATGIGTALKALKPGIKVYGVTAASAPAAYKSYKTNTPTKETPKYTLAEGVAVKGPDAYMLEALKASIDDIFSISEVSIAHAVALLAEHGKLVAEGAGALGVAAICENLIPEKNITAIVSGGNIDLPALTMVLQRGLVEQGRLIRLLITVIDRPGGLNALTQVLAESGANVSQIYHQRATLHTAIGEAEVEADIETRGSKHTEEIIQLLNNRGFKVQRVS
jgi:threonine dehydratase